jgi:hypothetical protein
MASPQKPKDIDSYLSQFPADVQVKIGYKLKAS